jgi:hypothetical protein
VITCMLGNDAHACRRQTCIHSDMQYAPLVLELLVMCRLYFQTGLYFAKFVMRCPPACWNTMGEPPGPIDSKFMNTPTREAQLLLDMNAAADCDAARLQGIRQQQQQRRRRQGCTKIVLIAGGFCCVCTADQTLDRPVSGMP